MNKKYFTKHLPVEGEIKEGDKVLYQLKHMTHTLPRLLEAYRHKDDKRMLYDDGTYNRKIGEGVTPLPEDITRVKLFLCSRDIQVGDKYRIDLPQFPKIHLQERECKWRYELPEQDSWQIGFDEGAGFQYRHEAFKVIGEISPDALSYVTEGQELDELEWSLFGYKKGQIHPDGILKNPEYQQQYIKDYIYLVCRIKGPCGHFH